MHIFLRRFVDILKRFIWFSKRSKLITLFHLPKRNTLSGIIKSIEEVKRLNRIWKEKALMRLFHQSYLNRKHKYFSHLSEPYTEMLCGIEFCAIEFFLILKWAGIK